MDYKELINSPGLWIASSIMIIAILCQSALFLRMAWKEAKKIGIPRERAIAGARSAVITVIGPTMSPIIILLALIAVLGAPTAWMRMNDIGAARTELAMVSIATNVIGIDPQSAAMDIRGYSYALWGMALNDVGWMLVTLVFTHRMSGMVDWMKKKYDDLWVKLLISGATIGLFAFLLGNRLTDKKPSTWTAAIVSGTCMLFISKVFAKNQHIQELALGISMLVGIFVTAAIFG